MNHKPVHFLLVEDDDDHAELVMMGLLAENGTVKTADRVRDGEEAISYLKRQGHEVLAAIKNDSDLRSIPVVVLTTSQAPEDKARAYRGHANSYLAKPMDFGEFTRMIKDLSQYWTVWNQSLS
jgi:CheY-like chemotaxis protein